MTRIVLLAVLAVLFAVTSVPAENQSGAGEFRSGMKKAAQDTGEAFRSMGKETGRAVRQGGRDIGKGFKEMGHETARESRKSGTAVGDWFRDLGAKIRDFFRGGK